MTETDTAAEASARVEIVALASSAQRMHVLTALDQLASLAVAVSTLAEATGRVGPRTEAVIACTSVLGPSPAHAVAALRDVLDVRDIPLLLLLDRPAGGDGLAHELYEIGATVVLQWPDEALLLGPLVADMLDADPRAPEAAETGLRDAVLARLRIDPAAIDEVDVRVVGSTAMLRGRVASAWARDRLARVVAGTPGVTRVVDHRVAVHTADVDDAALHETVAATLRSAGNAEARGLQAHVDGGIATIAGIADDPRTVTRVCNAVRQIPGIRRVHDRTRIGQPGGTNASQA